MPFPTAANDQHRGGRGAQGQREFREAPPRSGSQAGHDKWLMQDGLEEGDPAAVAAGGVRR
jgi:hypothetical protein